MMNYNELLKDNNEKAQIIANLTRYVATVQADTLELFLELMNETGPGKSGPLATDEFNRLKIELEQTIEAQRARNG